MGKTDACGGLSNTSRAATKGIDTRADIGVYKQLFFSYDKDFSFASFEATKDKANWDNAVAAGSLVYLGDGEIQDNGTDATFFENTALSFKKKQTEAIRSHIFRLITCACSTAELNRVNGLQGGVFWYTDKGFVDGRINDDGTVKGFDATLDIGLKTTADPNGDPVQYTPIGVDYNDARGDDSNPAQPKVSFTFKEIDQVERANLVVSNFVDAGPNLTFDVTMTEDCTDGAIAGGATANFKVSDANGADIATFTAVDATNGVYNFDVTTTESVVSVEVDGIQTIGNILYLSDSVNASA